MLYRVAQGTGFRAAELATLTPDSFDLAATTPCAVLAAAATKNRKPVAQPLACDLADELREFIGGKPGGVRLWPGTWAKHSADMLRLDLRAAEIPEHVTSAEGVETRDFHALRNCYISNVLRTGADMKQAMTLARHSDPRLTAARYARTRLGDLGNLVEKLPKAARRNTGSASAGEPLPTTTVESSGAATGAATGDDTRERAAKNDEPVAGSAAVPETHNALISQGVEGNRELLKTVGAERAGFEPAVRFYPYAALAKR